MGDAKQDNFILNDILQELGWKDGFQIPVSNFENRQLEEEVARLTMQKFKAKTGFDAATQKLENIESHVKRINQEFDENQNIIAAHVQTLHAEEEKLRVDSSEKGKVEQDMRKCTKKIKEAKERIDAKKPRIEKSAITLEKLKSETDWDTEALRAWEESLQKRDDDNELIKRFSREDERKYNQLEAKLQRLEVEYTERKELIERTVCDLTNYERILDRTGKTMKQQLTERDALIQQWKESVRILQQRDSNIMKQQNRVVELSEIMEKKREQLEEQVAFHENEMRNNEEIEQENHQLNVSNSKIRKDLNELVQHILLLNGQADNLRRTMLSSAKELETQRYTRKMIQSDIELLEARTKKCQEQVTALKAKHAHMRRLSVTTAEERIQQMRIWIDYEQKQAKILENEAKILQAAYFRIQQEVQVSDTAKKDRQLEIIGYQSDIKHIRKHNEEQRNIVNKQKERVYELDYKIDEAQSKIFSLENATYYTVDSDELEVKFADLEAQMSEHTDLKSLLNTQINKIQDDMRRLTAAISADQKQLSVLQDKLLHQTLSYEGGQKQLAQTKNTLQEKQVEESILMLRINQLNKAMKKQKQNIYSLQKLQLSLEQATKSRMVEIETHKEILAVKKRNLLDDRSRLKMDYRAREIRMEQIRKKYEIILVTFGKDETGQPMSVTHFKIKNAQDKFLMQSEGDELDSKIKKAEQEIVAMENTLKLVNLTNSKFKHSLDAVREDGAEQAELKQLEVENSDVAVVYREQKRDLEKKLKELDDLKTQLKELKEMKESEEERNNELSDLLVKHEVERDDKLERLQTTESRIRAAAKKVKPERVQKHEQNLEIQQMKEANSRVLDKLKKMSIENDTTMKDEIQRYLSTYDLESISSRRASLSKTPIYSDGRLSNLSNLSNISISSKFSIKANRSSALPKVEIKFDV